MARLQGLDLKGVNIPVSESLMGGLLGNGWAKTVIERILAAALVAAETAVCAPGGAAARSVKPATGGEPTAGGESDVAAARRVSAAAAKPFCPIWLGLGR